MNVEATLELAGVEIRRFENNVDQVTRMGELVRTFGSVPRPQTARWPDWFVEAQRQFQAISRLPHGWDSQGGDPPNRATVRSGSVLLGALATASPSLTKPHIDPTPSGGVQFHWESGPRYFEIDIVDPQTAQFYYVDAQREQEGTFYLDDDVAQVLQLALSVEKIA